MGAMGPRRHDSVERTALLIRTRGDGASVPDMKGTVGKLKAAGHSGIGEPRMTPRFSILMIKDPDGNQIELLGPGGS